MWVRKVSPPVQSEFFHDQKQKISEVFIASPASSPVSPSRDSDDDFWFDSHNDSGSSHDMYKTASSQDTLEVD